MNLELQRFKADFFKALAHPLRIRILELLADGDKNVNEFLKAIKRGDQIIIQAFTKTDKLTQSELGKLKRDFPDGIFISNLKKKGMLDLQNRITGYLFGN